MTNEYAKKVLTELRGYGDKFANIGFDRKEALDMAIKALEQQPTRPTGKWIDIGDEGLVFKCSLCGNKKTIESNYCPNCGAKMEGEYEVSN